jgi:hypothetical protein
MAEQMANTGPKYAIRLSDLCEEHIITAVCFRCGHRERMPLATLTWERPGSMFLTRLEAKLRCLLCGNRDNNSLTVGTKL